MAFRESPLGELKVPLTWTAAVALVVAAILAVALLLTDRREALREQAYGTARQTVDTVAAPVGQVVAAPVRATGQGLAFVGGYFFAVSENRRLRKELEDMRQWRDVAIALRDTNDRYKTLLGLKTDPPLPMVAARVVSDSRGPFANARLADAGRDKGVTIGNPVLSERGLVGRVVGVSGGVSRVVLLTDIASRTPVMIDRTNARAILAGDGGPNPKLDYLRGRDPVKSGDRVMTSGDGGVIPRGLPVGVAVKGVDGSWRVQLASDSAPIDFVRILLFKDFAQLANETELRQTVMPPVTTENQRESILGPAVPAPTPTPAPPRPATTTPPAARTPAPQAPATATSRPTPPATTTAPPQ
ncbi:MAG: rod shape-determining protein MreC [Caulobacterales bacterium]|nr:rod shape-determining protein MreC [Caulobacterales bacterium]